MIGYALSRIFLMTVVTIQPLVMALAWHHEKPELYDAAIIVILAVWAIVVAVVICRAANAIGRK